MGLQLIIVVETDKTNKSDYIYVKSTIEHFYSYDPSQVKLTPIYLGGKGNYERKQKDIASKISQYRQTGQSKVIYFFDCDEYNSKPEDKTFLDSVKKYCEKNNYEFVWFCKDVEHVYIGHSVEQQEKKKTAEGFKKNNLITKVKKNDLKYSQYQPRKSNILNVLDKYLESRHQ